MLARRLLFPTALIMFFFCLVLPAGAFRPAVLEIGGATGVKLVQLTADSAVEFVQTTDAEVGYREFSSETPFQVEVAYSAKTGLFSSTSNSEKFLASKIFVPEEFFSKNVFVYEEGKIRNADSAKLNVLRFNENLGKVAEKNRNLKLELALLEEQNFDSITKIKLVCNGFDASSAIIDQSFDLPQGQVSFDFRTRLALGYSETADKKKQYFLTKTIAVTLPGDKSDDLFANDKKTPGYALKTLCDGFSGQNFVKLTNPVLKKKIEITQVAISKSEIQINYKKNTNTFGAYLQPAKQSELLDSSETALQKYPFTAAESDLGDVLESKSATPEGDWLASVKLAKETCKAFGPQWLVLRSPDVSGTTFADYDKVLVDLTGTDCAPAEFTQTVFTPGKTGAEKIIRRAFNGETFTLDVSAQGFKLNSDAGGLLILSKNAQYPLKFGKAYEVRSGSNVYEIAAARFPDVMKQSEKTPPSLGGQIECFDTIGSNSEFDSQASALASAPAPECVVFSIAWNKAESLVIQPVEETLEEQPEAEAAVKPVIKDCAVSGDFYQGYPKRTWSWTYENEFQGEATIEFSFNGEKVIKTKTVTQQVQEHWAGAPVYKSRKFLVKSGDNYYLRAAGQNNFVKCSVTPTSEEYNTAAEKYLNVKPPAQELQKEAERRKLNFDGNPLEADYTGGVLSFKVKLDGGLSSDERFYLVNSIAKVDLKIEAEGEVKTASVNRNFATLLLSLDPAQPPSMRVTLQDQKPFTGLIASHANANAAISATFYFENSIQLEQVQGTVPPAVRGAVINDAQSWEISS